MSLNEYQDLTLRQIKERLKKKRLEQLDLTDVFLWEILNYKKDKNE